MKPAGTKYFSRATGPFGPPRKENRCIPQLLSQTTFSPEMQVA